MSDSVLRTLSSSFDWCAETVHWPVTTEVGPGLAGVIADTTRVMWLDPSSGRLTYRGTAIETLAETPDFEATAYLLITGSPAADTAESFHGFRDSLRASRDLPAEVNALVAGLSPTAHPTRVLRAGVSALGCHELSVSDDLAGARHWRELRIVGQVASLVSGIMCARRGRRQPDTKESESLAEGIITAMTGTPPTIEAVRALDLLWLLYAAHGLDAPTFTSMIVASCLADPYYNVVAGLSALRGSRQGGVGERLVEELLTIKDPSDAGRWVDSTLAAGGSIPGFGHRLKVPGTALPTYHHQGSSQAA